MFRLPGLLVVSAALVLVVRADAADAPAGSWKLTVLDGNQTLVLLKIESKDGKLTGKLLATGDGLPPVTVEEVRVDGDRVQMALKIGGQPFSFEGKIPKEAGKPILGTFARERQMFLAQLEPTTVQSLNRFDVSKEIVAKGGNDPQFFTAAGALLQQAGANKAKPEEVRGWADKAYRAAEAYGPRWQREITVRTAEALSKQDGFANVAVEYARRAERLLGAKDDAADQTRVLTVLAEALKKANKADEAKEVETRVAKLEVVADQEYLNKTPPFKTAAFAGRKGKSDRRVLVELFTGAQCPPCVAADVAFDALAKTYKPADVILLQYHLHVPRPDALSNAETEARQSYYDKDLEGTPTVFFNGQADAPNGGGIGESEEKYQEYRKVIDSLLEKPAKAQLKVRAVQKGNAIDIAAEVADLQQTGEQVRLRLALVEEQVKYIGTNGMRFHHHVVRAMPGGPKGIALTDKAGKQTATVNLDDLRKDLAKHLDAAAKQAPFPNAQRPMELKNLRVVAFIQDDKSKEVIQAAETAVGPVGEAG
jgi:hypothetical protein